LNRGYCARVTHFAGRIGKNSRSRRDLFPLRENSGCLIRISLDEPYGVSLHSNPMRSRGDRARSVHLSEKKIDCGRYAARHILPLRVRSGDNC
jgi:hypothetical protein